MGCYDGTILFYRSVTQLRQRSTNMGTFVVGFSLPLYRKSPLCSFRNSNFIRSSLPSSRSCECSSWHGLNHIIPSQSRTWRCFSTQDVEQLWGLSASSSTCSTLFHLGGEASNLSPLLLFGVLPILSRQQY